MSEEKNKQSQKPVEKSGENSKSGDALNKGSKIDLGKTKHDSKLPDFEFTPKPPSPVKTNQIVGETKSESKSED